MNPTRLKHLKKMKRYAELTRIRIVRSKDKKLCDNIFEDFKFTSQANHMQKLLAIKKDYEREGFHLQRLYKRRDIYDDGVPRSTFWSIVGDDNPWN